MEIELFNIKVKEIIGQGFSEIIKVNKFNYLFRITHQWFQLVYINKFGMVLQFRSGFDSKSFLEQLEFESETLLNGTKLRQKGDDLFEYIEKYYVLQLVFYADKVIDSIKKYILIIEKCDKVEKKSEKVFVIYFNKQEYIFEVIDRYNTKNQVVDSILEIHFKINGEIQTKKIVQPAKINEVIAVLNCVFYINATSKIELTNDEITNLFNCS